MQQELKVNRQWLLKEIKAIMYKFESQQSLFISLHVAQNELCTYKQKHDESLQTYFNNFKTKVEGLEHYGGTIGIDPGFNGAASKLQGSPTDKVPFCSLPRAGLCQLY
jgi:hypothetical protein